MVNRKIHKVRRIGTRGLKVQKVKIRGYRGGRKMSSVSERLQAQLAIVRSQKRESPIVMCESGHLVLTTKIMGLSMREQYLIDQGYDIEGIPE